MGQYVLTEWSGGDGRRGMLADVYDTTSAASNARGRPQRHSFWDCEGRAQC